MAEQSAIKNEVIYLKSKKRMELTPPGISGEPTVVFFREGLKIVFPNDSDYDSLLAKTDEDYEKDYNDSVNSNIVSTLMLPNNLDPNKNITPYNAIQQFDVYRDYYEIKFRKKDSEDPKEIQQVLTIMHEYEDERSITFWVDIKGILQSWVRQESSIGPVLYISGAPLFEKIIPDVNIHTPIPQGVKKLSPNYKVKSGDGTNRPQVSPAFIYYDEAEAMISQQAGKHVNLAQVAEKIIQQQKQINLTEGGRNNNVIKTGFRKILK